MTMTTNSQSNAMGITNIATGLIVTNADAAAAVTIQLGFAPRIVRFRNVTDRISDEWYEGMASASSIHTVAAGTVTLETTNGVAVSASANTFTLTATTMVASKTFVWEAIG
jgi:hypothetical protein